MVMLLEIADYLEGLGLGTDGTDLFLGRRPDAPDLITVLYEYPGGAPEYVQNSFMPVAEKPQIQVVTRAKKYKDAALRAQQVWQALAVVTNATLGGTYYRSIRPNASPAHLMQDTNNRTLMFFNCSVDKEVSLAAVS